MTEIADQIQEAVDKGAESRLNGFVAILVALTATFMALCNVKDGNVVQAMQQAQTRAVDQWTYYQAKGTKQNLAENSAEMLVMLRDTTSGLSKENRVAFDAKISDFRNKATLYEREKAEIKAEAEHQEKEYDRLNLHDDQFDMAEAAFTVAISLFGITLLARKKWLLIVAGACCCFGIAMGLAGFQGWNLHPDWLARLLG